MTKKPEDCYTWLAYMEEEGIITHDEYNTICKRLDDRTLKDFWEVVKKVKHDILGEN